MLRNKSLLLILFLLATLLVSTLMIINNQAKNSYNNQEYYIIGTHYFSRDSWAKNFWNSDYKNTINTDFKNIYENGFNTILLVVPWGEFQTSVNPPTYDESKFIQLDEVIQIAKNNNLNVGLRISYYWSLSPSDYKPSKERFIDLLQDERTYQAWLDYIKKINLVISSHDNVVIPFLSWEDLWLVALNLTNLSLNERQVFGKSIKYNDYISSIYTIDTFNKKYETKYSIIDDIPIPTKEDRYYENYLDFCDYLLVNRYYQSASKLIDNLSLEVRVDKDPIYEGGKIINWYSHHETYKYINSPYIVIYFSPAIGARNTSDYSGSDATLARLKYVIDEVRKHSDKTIFIDQFNFYDNTPEYRYNTQIKIKEINQFLESSIEYMKNEKIGYALWTYYDYKENELYNPDFNENLTGWNTNGAYIESSLGNNFVVLDSNRYIEQNVIGDQNQVCLHISCDLKDNSILVNNTLVQEVSSSFEKKCFLIEKSSKLYIFNNGNSMCKIDNIRFFDHIQEGLLFDQSQNSTDIMKSLKLGNFSQ